MLALSVVRVAAGGVLATPAWEVIDGGELGGLHGQSVSDAGDVNGDGYDDVVVGSRGRALVYLGSAAGLEPAPATVLTGESVVDGFGCSVSGAGDLNGDGFADLVIGAWQAGIGPGRVYVFHGSASGISGVPAATLDGDLLDSHFGEAVAGAGDVDGDGYDDLVVGAPAWSAFAGRVYLYHGSPAGVGAAPVTVLTGVGGEELGDSLSGAGDVNGDGYADVVVGAPMGNAGEGAAYVFHGSPTGLSLTPTTLSGDGGPERFGHSVSGAGDVNGDGHADVIVGESDYGGETGLAYVFHGSADGVGAVAAATLIGEASGDSFGYHVTGAGDLDGDGYDEVAISADLADEGQVYVFRGSAAGIEAAAAVSLTADEFALSFGASVSGAGDVDGDGWVDLIVGDPNADGFVGRTRLFRGSAGGLETTASTTLSGATAGSFGQVVLGGADLNGDGWPEVVVGSPALGKIGRVYVYHGSAAGPSTTPAVVLTGDALDEGSFGLALAAGDLNGDGYADLVVGASPPFTVAASTGRVFVYHGSAAGLGGAPTTTLEGEVPGDAFGQALASLGDSNGDGFADLAVGAPGYGDFGRVHVFHGSVDGIGSAAATVLTGAAAENALGVAVAWAGDVNGDGYADLAAGALGGWRTGRVYVHHGSASGVDPVPATVLTAEDPIDHFGAVLSSAGDVNGDGYADLVVAATRHDNAVGRVYVHHGSAAGLHMLPARVLTGTAWYESFGSTVAGAGDSNGDGYADLVVSATEEGSAEWYRGRVEVYHGSAAGIGSVAATTLADGVNGLFGYAAVAGAGDVNGDGVDDLLVGVCSTKVVTLHHGYLTDEDGDGALSDVDCDEGDGAVHPGAPEPAGDGVDSDCDGHELCYLDADQDGFRPDDATAVSEDPGCDGLGEASATAPSGDCDDAVAEVNPSAEERCNQVDDDCDGATDLGAVDEQTWYADADHDGYTDLSSPAEACEPPPGFAAATDDDCDDADASTRPGATEVPGDGVDQDCDGADAAAGLDDKGCGCAGTGPGAAGGGALLAAAAAVLRDRRRSGSGVSKYETVGRRREAASPEPEPERLTPIRTGGAGRAGAGAQARAGEEPWRARTSVVHGAPGPAGPE